MVVFGAHVPVFRQRLAEAVQGGAAWAVDHGEWETAGGLPPPVLVARALSEQPLPWVEGATYFGLDAAFPGLYLPTARKPVVPGELLLATLRANGPAHGEILLLEVPNLCLHLGAPWPVSWEEISHGY
jgi:hypothetical protein